MQIAHIADTHLGAAQYGLEEREKDLYECFNEFVEKVIEEHVKIVVHSGDVFHNARPSISALRTFQIGLKKLHEHGVKIYAIPGGHDMLKRRGLTPLLLFDYLDLTVLSRKRPVVRQGDLLIAGIEYIPRAFRKDLVNALGRIQAVASRDSAARKILVLHQALGEIFPPSHEISINELPAGFSYYALGHVHYRRILTRDGKTIAYPGSIENLDLQEAIRADKRGFFIVDLSADQPQLEFIELENVRPQIVREVKYSELSSIRRLLLQEVKNLGARKKPILHLRIMGRNIAQRLVDRELVEPLMKHALTIRTHIFEEGMEDMVSLETISLLELLEKRLGNRELAAFALRLVDLLGRGEDNAVKEAIREAERIFEDGSWKRWRR